MARRVRDANLESREARTKLKSRDKPYWRAIERGLHLGFRKPKGGGSGKWVVRHYLGNQSYEVETIAAADDKSDADGVAILDFWQATKLARKRMVERAHRAAGRHGPLTVADAIAAYFEHLETKRKSVSDARYRADAHILPKLGAVEVAALEPDQLRKWFGDLAKAPARLRTKKGQAQQYRPVATDDDARRRRQSSSKRTLTILKAALNQAFHDGKVASDSAWRRVKPPEGVDAARIRYLTIAEAKRLINASGSGFRDLVHAALLTGARYGELTRLTVADFIIVREPQENGSLVDVGKIAIWQSKSGKPRHVVLTDEGAAFFAQLCAGRIGSELMLRNAAGAAWKKSHQNKPMHAACVRAKIAPPIGFHGLRHTYATLAVTNGVPLMVVARNLGHRDTTMVERHYGHMPASYITDAIRAGAPRFGAIVPSNVTTIDSTLRPGQAEKKRGDRART
jgi:integrase